MGPEVLRDGLVGSRDLLEPRRPGICHRFLLLRVAVSNNATFPPLTLLGPLRAVGWPHAVDVSRWRPSRAPTAGLCHSCRVTQHLTLTFGPVGYIQGPQPVTETRPPGIGPSPLPSACEEGVQRLREVTVACRGLSWGARHLPQ